ncbi:hypothetical protein D3C76_911700 [compost metagenome]
MPLKLLNLMLVDQQYIAQLSHRQRDFLALLPNARNSLSCRYQRVDTLLVLLGHLLNLTFVFDLPIHQLFDRSIQRLKVFAELLHQIVIEVLDHLLERLDDHTGGRSRHHLGKIRHFLP